MDEIETEYWGRKLAREKERETEKVAWVGRKL